MTELVVTRASRTAAEGLLIVKTVCGVKVTYKCKEFADKALESVAILQETV